MADRNRLHPPTEIASRVYGSIIDHLGEEDKIFSISVFFLVTLRFHFLLIQWFVSKSVIPNPALKIDAQQRSFLKVFD